MNEKILFVDDDTNILAGYQRSLRKQYNMDIACGGEAALELLSKNTYAVITTDMNMPGMDGIQLLGRIKESYPNTVRMMLTGNADLKTAIDAVHRGNVFRFLVKPFPAESMAPALDAALEQYRLLTAETELLEKTLRGSIRVLIEILSMMAPELFGRAQALKQNVRMLADTMQLSDTWKLELAAMLSQIGVVTVPQSVLHKWRTEQKLNDAERKLLERVPEFSHNLIINIPRLEPVAKIILYHTKNYDGSGFPADSVAGENIPKGARVLKILVDLAAIEQGGLSKVAALMAMKRRTGLYDPQLLQAAVACFALLRDQQRAAPMRTVEIDACDLKLGYVLAADIMGTDGTLLISSGHRISETLLARIKNFIAVSGIQEPVLIEDANASPQRLAA